MSKDLLLEIGTEEVPAHAMPGILDELAEKLGLDELPHWTSSSSGEGVQELRDALEALADED